VEASAEHVLVKYALLPQVNEVVEPLPSSAQT